MKRLFYFMIMLMTVSACHNIDDELSIEKNGITKLEASLNLIAPNGQKIASDISELKKNAGINDAEIISIEFMEVKKGFMAIVDYLTKDNDVLNFGVYSKEAFTFTKLKTKGESGSGSGITYVDCKPKAGSKCKKCRVIIYADGGEPECDCRRPDEVSSSECEKIKTSK